LLVKAINEYIDRKQLIVEVRFDIIAIHKEASNFVLEHIEDAFHYF
jgi:putative endonuclease